MLIIMSKEATPEQVDDVLHKIHETGAAEGFVSKGEFHTLIGVIGDPERVAQLPLVTFPGVEGVQRVSRPYKLVSKGGQQASTVQIGNVSIGPDTFTLIAGPCAVENQEQTLMAARAAKDAGAQLLRGGAYKPRTSPYSFQGLGVAGLEILADVGRQTGMPVVTEILDSSELDEVCKHADMLQVGTRNMSNFSLLKKVSLTGKPVLLKRGMSATVEEWLMAAEYLAKFGNMKIVLCERGIRTFEPSTRNTLDISAVPVVKAESHLPIVVDPSHAAGKKSLVAPLARAAVAVGADGIMVDVHCEPENALADGPQALVPAEIKELGGELRQLAELMGKQT